ncbi:MAG TPA: hypothetical protein VHZ30_05565 [Verrucomicrobiae bacterium]|jgi:hypothetical protein|nr:hypothetical protein [Verrucomicrobiae bacterium]
MRFVPAPATDGAQIFRFQISKLEKALLLATAQIYPVLDPSNHHLTKDPDDAEPAEQRLLEEAMARQRAEHKAKLDVFLAGESPAFTEDAVDLYLNLKREELEWLLQVLNDIRVGCWVKLGSPEMDQISRGGLSPEDARSAAAMDMGAYFQSELLKAFK